MTVTEMIEALKALPPDVEVVVTGEGETVWKATPRLVAPSTYFPGPLSLNTPFVLIDGSEEIQ